MHGFFGSYGKEREWDLSVFAGKSYIKREHKTHPFHITQITLPKFLNDKYFFEKDDCFLAIEGVLFVADSPSQAIDRYRQGETTFWDNWRGSFAGILYDKRTESLLLFNDHIGSHLLFYTQLNNNLLFTSDLPILTKTICQYTAPTYNEQFAWSMLSFGYSPIGETPITHIQRIEAGQYLYIQGNKVEKHIYHRFSITPNTLSEEENMQQVEVLFRQAVQRVLDKNHQYGLKHTAALSAGLDSRMSVCIARELTEEPIDVVTYSQSGFYDEIIPKSIAEAWKLNIHFTGLDGGKYLQNVDATNSITGGIISYAGAAQVVEGFRSLNCNQTGVVLTGMLGDIVLSSRQKRDLPSYAGLGAVSTRFINHTTFVTSSLLQKYPMQELYYLYVRGFNCADLGSPLILQTTGESYSPFYDIDLLQFCLTIPQAQRFNYHLYDRWIHTYHPQAAQWAHNGTRTIGNSIKKVGIAGREIPLRDLPKRIVWYLCKKLHIYNFYQENAGHSMNPMDQWYAETPALRKILDDYINENICLLAFSQELQHAALNLYKSGTMMEKTLVLTLLAAMRLNQLSANDGNNAPTTCTKSTDRQ